MKKTKTKSRASYLGLALMLAASLTACNKYLPQERETVGPDSQFTVDTYEPVLGRTNFFTDNFFKGSTTFPAEFKVVNPRRRNGDPAAELTDLFPVKVWKQAYTGDETSLAEVEAKRETQFRPLLEISPRSGAIMVWSEARSAFMRSLPDSGYLFDVELTNSGGRRYYRDLKLMPYRERPYEPSNLNAITGQPSTNGVTPSQVTLVKGDTSNRYLSFFDIDVYIRRISSGDIPQNRTGRSITFRFLDKNFKPMDPDNFGLTNWQDLIHGFERVKNSTGVTYQVNFPIPAIEKPTRFTTPDGRRARARFAYSRLGFGGVREDAVFGIDFAIYEAGDWEIVFAFKNDNPKFTND
jgi:hypothetical protein